MRKGGNLGPRELSRELDNRVAVREVKPLRGMSACGHITALLSPSGVCGGWRRYDLPRSTLDEPEVVTRLPSKEGDTFDLAPALC